MTEGKGKKEEMSTVSPKIHENPQEFILCILRMLKSGSQATEQGLLLPHDEHDLRNEKSFKLR